MREAQSTLAEIRPDSLYPLPLFKTMAGLGDWAMREARRRGLVVKKVGRRHFVKGSDWITYTEKVGEVVGGNG